MSKAKPKPTAVPDLDPENLDLESMAKIAEKLDIPLWMLMIPGLAKHKELLKPGALKPLQAIIETYIAGTPTRRADMEQALANAHQARIDETMALSKTAEAIDRKAAAFVAAKRAISDRVGEIQGRVYLAANLASLITPRSDDDIEMHTVMEHLADMLDNLASECDPNVVLAAEVAHAHN